MRRMKGTNQKNLPLHLSEQWYRTDYQNNGPLIFQEILKDLKETKQISNNLNNIKKESKNSSINHTTFVKKIK